MRAGKIGIEKLRGFFVVVKGRMEWCVLSMLYALVQLLLNRKQMGGREGGEH